MTREEKAVVIDGLVERMNSNSHYYFTDTSDFTVAEVNEFRGMLFQHGLELYIAKNTLLKKALDQIEGDFTELDEILKGSTGVIFSEENGSVPAKAIKEFRKKFPRADEKPGLKGASIEGAVYVGNEHLDSLSKLKSREELIGEVIGLLQSPAKNVVSALTSGQNKLAGIVKTLQERGEES
ncbi:MAG: 50S ribosomal protein L10 [Bacteroidota bacterium]